MIADRTGCQWLSRSFKVNDLQIILKLICCDFLFSDQYQPKPYILPFARYGHFCIEFPTPSFNPKFENMFPLH